MWLCKVQEGFFIDGDRVAEKNMTTPSILETLYHMREAVSRGVKYFIMEVSSHAIDQNRVEGISFALKVHTNVTERPSRYHKEYRGDIGGGLEVNFFGQELKVLPKKLFLTYTDWIFTQHFYPFNFAKKFHY